MIMEDLETTVSAECQMSYSGVLVSWHLCPSRISSWWPYFLDHLCIEGVGVPYGTPGSEGSYTPVWFDEKK